MLDSFVRDILVMVLLASPVALAILLTHFHNVKKFDRGLARLRISRQLGLLALFVLYNLGLRAFQDAAGRQAIQTLTFLLFGLFGGALLVTALRQRNTPSAVLDLGTSHSTPEPVIVVLGLASCGLFVLALYASEYREIALTSAVFCLLLASGGALSRRDKTLVTQDGLYIHHSLIKWKRIKRLAWAEHRGDTVLLIVQIAGRPFLFDVEEIRVAVDKQEAVNHLVADRVSAGAFS